MLGAAPMFGIPLSTTLWGVGEYVVFVLVAVLLYILYRDAQ